MSKKNYIRIISFLSALSLVLGVTSIVYGIRSSRLSYLVKQDRERSLSLVSEAFGEIETSLLKSLYTSSGDKLFENGEELSRLCTQAKIGLSEISEESVDSSGLYKFLSQVGDYTISLSKKEALTLEDRKNLRTLYNYSKSLCEGFEGLSADYFDNEVSFEKALGNLEKDGAKLSFLSSFEKISQTMSGYPTLLYDGPFSDKVLNRKPEFLNSKKEITKEEGKKIAGEILSLKPSVLKEEADQDSLLPLYVYSKGEKNIGITKKGGVLAYITNPDFTGERTISEKEAIERGKKELKKLGFNNMKESYYSVFDDVCTINFAHNENGVVCYADLVKIGIALDSGKMVSFDSRGYLYNHRERKLNTREINLSECKKGLSPELTVKGEKLALIPLKDGKEKLCAEFHCTSKDGKEFLVYIDPKTNEQEDILILLYSDDGVLTK